MQVTRPAQLDNGELVEVRGERYLGLSGSNAGRGHGGPDTTEWSRCFLEKDVSGCQP